MNKIKNVKFINGAEEWYMHNGEYVKESLEVLSKHSELAKQMLEEETIYFGDFSFAPANSYCSSDTSSFHPNGRSGCVIMNDNYLFGISCDHLMWMEGCVETSEKYDIWDDDWMNLEGWPECIVVMGNHKGTFMGYIIGSKIGLEHEE